LQKSYIKKCRPAFCIARILTSRLVIWVASASDNEDRVRAYLPAVLIAFASLMVSSAGALAPANPQNLLAVFPPWWSRAHVFAAASPAGAVAGFGPLPFLVAVESREPRLSDRLKASGALLLLDASSFRFCAI
jgi:hypothetical protein